MGVPLGKLLVATNRNDILPRFLASGVYEAATVHPTIAPSMDIQVASNFERLLFNAYAQDAGKLNSTMSHFAKEKRLEVEPCLLADIRRVFDGHAVEEPDILSTMRTVHQESGMLLDPHTAIAVAAGRARWATTGAAHASGDPIVYLATAHPAKFPDAVQRAVGIEPSLPEHMQDIMHKPERYTVLPNSADAVRAYVEGINC
jgi:threonine synthase